MQDGAERVPRNLPVGPEFRHDFVEPDVGSLERPVEHVY
jgi:hypothetical protein